ncbi:MAG: hypothetical protein KGO96_00260 [Elusimicrobia bacterium]|nr:hypothetical protein [Elusimicrobiota bacterium]MDE2424326.1 hypothetical protein [Elusimicrobiota bacterium]
MSDKGPGLVRGLQDDCRLDEERTYGDVEAEPSELDQPESDGLGDEPDDDAPALSPQRAPSRRRRR